MSIFRNLVWFIKGMKEYTRSGYASASKDFISTDLDLPITGMSYMITGANSGLGKATALALAKKGGTIHMVCRNKERGEEAKAEIINLSSNENVYLHQLDTSKPKDIYQFTKSFQESGQTLDVLINNAGCMINTREITEDGLEVNFATNTLGTHILTTALIPVLSNSMKPRVIIVSSGGMLTQTLKTKDLQFEKMKPFDGTMAYAQNKRQQIIMTEQYAKMFPKIYFYSMHPGWADTPAVQSAMPQFYEKMKNKLRTVEEGADTVIWLAVADGPLKAKNGSFFQDRQAVSTHLPLAWTKSTVQEDESLMLQLDTITKQFDVQP
ncbi:hypothetical protein ACF0H5_020753 [Mactra antiquata]